MNNKRIKLDNNPPHQKINYKMDYAFPSNHQNNFSLQPDYVVEKFNNGEIQQGASNPNVGASLLNPNNSKSSSNNVRLSQNDPFMKAPEADKSWTNSTAIPNPSIEIENDELENCQIEINRKHIFTGSRRNNDKIFKAIRKWKLESGFGKREIPIPKEVVDWLLMQHANKREPLETIVETLSNALSISINEAKNIYIKYIPGDNNDFNSNLDLDVRALYYPQVRKKRTIHTGDLEFNNKLNLAIMEWKLEKTKKGKNIPIPKELVEWIGTMSLMKHDKREEAIENLGNVLSMTTNEARKIYEDNKPISKTTISSDSKSSKKEITNHKSELVKHLLKKGKSTKVDDNSSRYLNLTNQPQTLELNRSNDLIQPKLDDLFTQQQWNVPTLPNLGNLLPEDFNPVSDCEIMKTQFTYELNDTLSISDTFSHPQDYLLSTLQKEPYKYDCPNAFDNFSNPNAQESKLSYLQVNEENIDLTQNANLDTLDFNFKESFEDHNFQNFLDTL